MGNPPKPPEPRFLKRFRTLVLDLLYPPVCALCDEPLADNRSLCTTCNTSLPRLRAPFCSICGEPFDGRIDGTFDCPNCRDLEVSFSFARPALRRDERTLHLIHRLKYSRSIHLAHELGHLALESFSDTRLLPALEEKWPLVPVPLHRKRHQHRHFNQAAEIARSLSGLTGLPVLHALKRIRHTPPQTRLPRKERLANLRQAFVPAAIPPDEKPGAVLVDDVFTTGSTVDACAKVLRQAGFRSIAVVTVMRG